MKNLTSILVRSLLALWLTTLSAWAVVNIDPPTRTFTKDGGGGSILTSGSGTWTATANVPWLNITPRTSGNAGESCIYVVSSNFSADTRQGTITVNDKVHTVTQTGYAATLTPTSATINLTGGARTVSISTSAGVSWTAVSNVPWITVGTPSGVGSGTVNYTVASYTGVTTRTGTLIIGNQTFTVSQTGADVNLSPTSVEKAYSSDIVMVQVSALSTTNWTATSTASWISVVDSGNGFGDSTVTLGIGTNPSFLERTGTVQIGSATFTIRQSGTPNPIIDILPKEATAEPTGAFGNIAVIATPDAPWKAESLSPWIIASGLTGAGNGNISYVASANPTLIPRTGTVRVYAPVALPKVDLTLALLAHVPTGSTDVSGWLRHLSGTIETRMDGSFYRNLTGPDFLLDQDTATVAFRFSVETVGAIHRLFSHNANSRNIALYVNSANRLVFQSGATLLTSDFTIEANKEFHVILTASASNEIKIYAGEVGTTIRLAGSSTFPQSPFPFSTPSSANAFKIGYADLPSSGYLNGGIIKELRIYGRALNVDEIVALFSFALSGTPYGPISIPAINPVASYNLRGQAALTGGSATPTEQGKAYPIMPVVTSGLTSSWTAVCQTPYNANTAVFDTNLAIPVTSSVTGKYYYISRNPPGFWIGGSQTISVQVEYLYEDGSSFTSTQNVNATHGNTDLTTSVTRTLTFINPNPQKWVRSTIISAQRTISPNDPSFPPSFSYAIGPIDANIPTVSRNSVSGIEGLSQGADRFSALNRALRSLQQGELRLWQHQSYFSGTSASYRFWLRCEELPPTGTKVRIFKRAGLLNHLLTLELDSSGGIVLSNGAQTTTLNAGIKAKQWQMLTLSGAFGSSLTAYVDGEEIGNTNLFNTYNFGSANGDPLWMRIGGWTGSLGNIAFYDGALTSSQVKSIYDDEKAVFLDHMVTQGVVEPSISPTSATIAASGGTATTNLVLASNVNWTASSSAGWLQITAGTSGAGSAAVTVSSGANPSVTPRTAQVTIAGKIFTVTQSGTPATVTTPETIFGTDGGGAWVDVVVGGSAQWASASNASWLTVALGETGSGTGSVFIIADPYTDTSRSRTGTVTIAGQTIYFTQRGYELSISPQVAQIGSNAGAGEFGVAAPLSAIWEAIVTEPWITINGGPNGIGNGTVRYSVVANTTGQARTGKIIVSGVHYTITQATSLFLTTETSGGGSVSGAGPYNTNAVATVTATPAIGFVFSHWSGDAVGSANPLQLNMDTSKTVAANFIPVAAADSIAEAAVQSVISDPNSHGLYTPDQMRTLALGRPVLERDPGTGKFLLKLGVQKSTNLNQWLALPITGSNVTVNSNDVQVEFTSPDGAAFFRVLGNE
jgi:hypothetical protein